MNKFIVVAVLAALMVGCATGVDPNYKLRLETQLAIESKYAEVAKANALALQARYAAVQKGMETGDTTAKTVGMVILGGIGGGGQQELMARVPAPVPTLETNSDTVLKYFQALSTPTAMLVSGYFGYKMGVVQSNNAAATTIAGYNTFGTMAGAGYTAASNIATAGFNSNGTLAGFIQAPQPNQTFSGTGVWGSGTYAPVTTTNSNNRNCTSGSGGVGNPGGAGGAANC